MPQARRIVPSSGVRPGRNRTGADIAAKLIVKDHAAQGVDAVQLAAAATDTFRGVTMAAIKNNENGDIQVEGRAIVTSGGAIAIGDLLTSDAAAKAVAAAPAGGTNNGLLGKAMSAAAGANEDVEVELATPGARIQG